MKVPKKRMNREIHQKAEQGGCTRTPTPYERSTMPARRSTSMDFERLLRGAGDPQSVLRPESPSRRNENPIPGVSSADILVPKEFDSLRPRKRLYGRTTQT